MKAFGLSILATFFLYFFTMFIIAPIMSNIGYSSIDISGYYHLHTHALLVTLIFTVIICTIIGSQHVVEEIKRKDDDTSEK